MRLLPDPSLQPSSTRHRSSPGALGPCSAVLTPSRQRLGRWSNASARELSPRSDVRTTDAGVCWNCFGSALAEEALIPRVMRARRREDVLATVGEFTYNRQKQGPLGVIAPTNDRLLCVLIR